MLKLLNTLFTGGAGGGGQWGEQGGQLLYFQQ